MPLSDDNAPLADWTIPKNASGPFSIDSWETSYKGVFAHRVVGITGHQLHTAEGSVLQFDKDYAQALCDAANQGQLQIDAS